MDSELKNIIFWIGLLISILIIMSVFFTNFTDKEIILELGNWPIVNCDASSCDLSNWFAELLFGIMIGVGIFAWQRLEHRKRAGYFIGQVYDILYTFMYELYNIQTSSLLKMKPENNSFESALNNLMDVDPEEYDDDIIDFVSRELPNYAFEHLTERCNNLKNITPKLRHFLSVSGASIDGKLQESIDQLLFNLDQEFGLYNNRWEFATEIDLLLRHVLVIMKYNKKKLKESLGIEDGKYKEMVGIFRQTEIIPNNFDTKEWKNYYLWYIAESLSEKQDDWYQRPKFFQI